MVSKQIQLALLCAGLSLSGVSQAQVYWREDFRNYRDTAPVCSTGLGITIDNDPIWTQTAGADCRMLEAGYVFKEFCALPGLKDFDVLFKFKRGQFALHLQHGTTGIVSVAAVPDKKWHTGVVTVRAGKLTLYVDERRVLKPVATMDVPAVTGLNFFGHKGAPFSITDIIVRPPGPLPDYSIQRLLPARRADDGGWSAEKEVIVPANDVFGATIRAPATMTTRWADGKTNVLTFAATSVRDEKLELPDGVIQIKGLGKTPLRCHIRPMLRRYRTSYSFTDTYHDIVRDWELLPKASTHPLKVECRRTPKGVDFYFDGSFAGSLDDGAVTEVMFSGTHKDVFSTKAGNPQYLPLDLVKSFTDAKVALKSKLPVPMKIGGSADVGPTRQGQGNWALEVDEYLARSPFDGFLSEVHFTVPAAPYTKAWVLFAIDPTPGKEPILTTRIGHYVENGSGANMLADTVRRLPDNATPVGTVANVPLYLIEIPLDTGKIIDLAMSKPYLNFEFFGKPWENFQQLDNSCKPDPNSTSSIQIFGVTLEKSPVGFELIQAQPGNIFHNDEKPVTTVVLRSFAPARGSLTWEIPGVGTGSASYDFAQAGAEQKIEIPLTVPDVGWYELLLTLRDEAGKSLLVHPARFAVLGPDTRKARYDSPYGVWWFDGAHNTPKELDFAGPIMFKAGIRNVAWTGQKEKAMEKWFITKDQVNMPFTFKDRDTNRAEKVMQKLLQDYPHARKVAIFHESGPGNDIPVELLGLKPDLNEAHQRYADLFNLAGKFFRENYPQLKTVVGNNSCSAGTIAAILRHGGKVEYLDYIGIESPSQVFIPEKLQEFGIQGQIIARDTVKTLTGRDVPATGCYEFTYRSERDMGEQQQAEWYTRDILISLANRFTRIGPGILFDCANAYYNGLWGSSGLLQRGPWGYPKKAYVAYATITKMLDQVTLRRQIPTGSTTVYALEFDRSDKKRVAALWAARGDAEFIIEYAGDTPVTVVDMYGRARILVTGKLTVKAGTSPVYVVAEKEINNIALGARTFPKDEARAKRATVIAALDQVAIDADKSLDTPLVAPLQLPIRQRGEFELRQATDGVELVLKTDKPISKYITEYTTLRLKQPVAVAGTPSAIGVWVKGNSGWGRVMFEIEDAEGEIWRSVGTGGWGCDILDWPGNIAVNFDGWNFIALPLRDSKLFNDHSPGPVLEQWVSNGGNKTIDFPIKVRALIVEMNRQALDLTEMKPVKPMLHLRGLATID